MSGIKKRLRPQDRRSVVVSVRFTGEEYSNLLLAGQAAKLRPLSEADLIRQICFEWASENAPDASLVPDNWLETLKAEETLRKAEFKIPPNSLGSAKVVGKEDRFYKDSLPAGWSSEEEDSEEN